MNTPGRQPQVGTWLGRALPLVLAVLLGQPTVSAAAVSQSNPLVRPDERALRLQMEPPRGDFPSESESVPDRQIPRVPLADRAASELRVLWLIDAWLIQQQLLGQADQLEAWVYLRGTEAMVQDLERVRLHLAEMQRRILGELSGDPSLTAGPTAAPEVLGVLAEAKFRLMMLAEMARLDGAQAH